MDRNEKQNSLKNIRITRDSVKKNKNRPKGMQSQRMQPQGMQPQRMQSQGMQPRGMLVKGLASLLLLTVLGFGGSEIYRHSPLYKGQAPKEAAADSREEGGVQVKPLAGPEPASEMETSGRAESITETSDEPESVTEAPAEAESRSREEIPQETQTEAAGEPVSEPEAGNARKTEAENETEAEAPEMLGSTTEAPWVEEKKESETEMTTRGADGSDQSSGRKRKQKESGDVTGGMVLNESFQKSVDTVTGSNDGREKQG